MSLIVEDGAGKIDAESYISVADCTTYCTAHGLTGWTGTDSAKEIALRLATQYIDSMYSFRYEKTYVNQALEFPRWYWEWSNPAMNKLRAACCELAVKSMTVPLFADVEPSTTIKVKVGPIEKTMRPVETNGQKTFKQVDMLLRELIVGLGNTAIVRA